jgi:hypothetical protein
LHESSEYDVRQAPVPETLSSVHSGDKV